MFKIAICDDNEFFFYMKKIFAHIGMIISHNEVTSYPLLIEMLKRDKTIDPQAYINKKIERLNRFLMNFDEVKK